MKRACDIVLSLLGLVILLPILILIFFWIILDSKGGAIYFQTRVGKNNKDFRLIKFRTMYKDSDKKGLITVGKRDPRITKAGYFLRKTKLDELPQLINILKGEMSFVGPRPEVRKYVDLYTPEQMKVLSVRPGLTDYSSLSYIDESELLDKHLGDKEEYYIRTIMPDKIKLSLQYIKNQSLTTDLKIIIKTLLKLIR